MVTLKRWTGVSVALGFLIGGCAIDDGREVETITTGEARSALEPEDPGHGRGDQPPPRSLPAVADGERGIVAGAVEPDTASQDPMAGEGYGYASDSVRVGPGRPWAEDPRWSGGWEPRRPPLGFGRPGWGWGWGGGPSWTFERSGRPGGWGGGWDGGYPGPAWGGSDQGGNSW